MDDFSSKNQNTRVLVTGASGFLAIHCVRLLLEEGYQVRGTVRDSQNILKTQPLKDLNGSQRLELCEADLEDERPWSRIVEGCEFILHIASPCQVVADDSIISTAVNGTLNVLRAAARCSTVRKIVITSSCGAVNEGWDEPKRLFNENDWTDLNGKYVHTYHKSKTLAERAAWDFVNKNSGVNFQLTVLNPGLMVGPLLQNVKGASATIIGRFLDGSMPAYPSLKIALVDVEDVARAHVFAMRNTETNGERILLTACTLSFRQIAKILRKEFARQGYRIPRLKVPYALLWAYSHVDAEAKPALDLYGHEEYFDNSKAKHLLKINFADPTPALKAMVYDMIERGMLPKKKKLRQP